MTAPTSPRCEFCQHSEWRDKESMKCIITPSRKYGVVVSRFMIVQRFDSCDRFVRESGADDEVAT